MENNSYLAKKCDAVDRTLDCGSDLVYATVNAIIYLTLYYKTYTNSALGFCGSSPATTDPQVVVHSFAPWYNVHAVLRCHAVLKECLSGNAITNSSVIAVASDSSFSSLLPSNADFKTSVTMCDDHSIVACYFDTGGAVPHFALFTPVQKVFDCCLVPLAVDDPTSDCLFAFDAGILYPLAPSHGFAVTQCTLASLTIDVDPTLLPGCCDNASKNHRHTFTLPHQAITAMRLQPDLVVVL